MFDTFFSLIILSCFSSGEEVRCIGEFINLLLSLLFEIFFDNLFEPQIKLNIMTKIGLGVSNNIFNKTPSGKSNLLLFCMGNLPNVSGKFH